MNIPDLDLPRIVIIGSGFAGLKLARTIDTRVYQVVLLDRNNYHTFQPLLYQVATGGLEPDSIAYPIRKIFNRKPHAHFRMADVHAIHPETHQVTTAIGDLRYDKLVITTGADTNFFGMTQVERFGMSMKSLTASLDLRSLVLQHFEQALLVTDLRQQERLMTFVIVGAGPTGVELAGALAELKRHVLPRDYPDLDLRRMQIHLIEAADRVLATMSAKASMQALRFLRRLGVNVWLNTQVRDYDGQTVRTTEKNFEAETLIWAAGVQGAPVAGLDASAIGRGNRIAVDEYGRVVGYEDIYALGDVAHMTTSDAPEGFPMLGSVAQQQGKWLGTCFNAMAAGKTTKPFSYTDKGTMATIGRNKAVVDLPFWHFSGLVAWFAWMFVHLMLLVDFRSRMVVFVNWAWSYIRYDKSTRLIVRPFRREIEEQV